MIQRIFHYYNKIKLIGLARFYKAARARVRLRGKRIADVCPSTFNRSLTYVHNIAMKPDVLLNVADACARNQFSFLGSRPACYLKMPWYEDVRSGDGFDIKVPWEFARFQYAPVLAHAYRQKNNTKYHDALKKQIISFLDTAPFLEGIHWSNPMEVAIRATNWIVAYQIVQGELQKDAQFHERLINSLWQHMLFIESNWELYDGRTNNHYLSNLVGYSYLAWFFNDAKRWRHCWNELQSEFAWQIQDDGSSYEGSTSYHGFVTELFVHGFLVAQQMGEIITSGMCEKLARMLQFADATKSLCIGDDDSGSLLHPGLYDVRELARNLSVVPFHKKDTHLFYPNFGLSIINSKPFKISLRHHAYHGRQPSAHFHEDVGSITLSYNGIPILVDPGSYLYTGSKTWRNYFRSAAQHSTFFPVGWNQKGDDLFALRIPDADAQCEYNESSIRTTYSLYGYPVSREIAWSNGGISIQDDAHCATDVFEWQFIFAPDIELEKKNGNWDIVHDSKVILQFNCNELMFEKRKTWISPAYGVKQKAWALWATGVHRLDKIDICFNKS